MFNNKRLDFYLKVYDDAIEMKENINSRITILFGIIQLLWPACYFFWNDSLLEREEYLGGQLLSITGLKLDVIDWQTGFYKVFILFFLLGIIFSSFCIFKAMFRHKYTYISSPVDIYQYEKDLRKYFKENSERPEFEGLEEEDFVSKKFEEYLISELNGATDQNQNSNKKKLSLMRIAVYSIIVTLVMALACLIFYICRSV